MPIAHDRRDEIGIRPDRCVVPSASTLGGDPPSGRVALLICVPRTGLRSDPPLTKIAGDDSIIRPKIDGLIPLRAREHDSDRGRDAHNACRAEQPLSKRIAGSASRLAGEIEKLHLEPRGEGERKRCNETAPATFEPARGFTD